MATQKHTTQDPSRQLVRSIGFDRKPVYGPGLYELVAAFLMWAIVVLALVVLFGCSPARADDSFIFNSNSVVSALDTRQSLRLGERLSLAQIKRRLPSYTVEKSNACEGDCIHVSGRNGVYLELDYNNPGKPIFGINGYLGTRDVLGRIVGMSLIKAIGSDRATCDLGMTTTCASRSIKNLSYEINDDRCTEEDKITTAEKDPSFQYHLAECMTVGSITIYKRPAKLGGAQ
jgi:hypothetical protein